MLEQLLLFESKKLVKKDLSKYERLVLEAGRSGVNVEDVFSDISVKKRHLKDIMGYKALNGPNGEWIPLVNAKDSRIGKAYLDHYNRARRQLGKN